MRAAMSSLRSGALLTAAVVLVILISSAAGLELESSALAGVLAGGVVGLVPDGSPWSRLGGFAVGFLAAWVGFVLRAAALPDTDGGRAAAAVVTMLICLVAVTAAHAFGRGRAMPLWSALVGVVVFSAAYEAAFVAAEPEVASTSLNAATSLLAVVAVGYVVAVLSAGREAITAEGGEAVTTTRSSVFALRPRQPHASETASAPSREATL